MKEEETKQISAEGLLDEEQEENLELAEQNDADEKLKEVSKVSHGLLNQRLKEVSSLYLAYRVDWWNCKRWFDYMKKTRDLDCLQLPILNKYLSEWDEDNSYDIQSAFMKCHECLKFCDDLEFAMLAGRHVEEKQLNYWKEGIENTKKTVSKKLDFISFMLLKDAEKYLDSKDENMEFIARDSEEDVCTVTLCLWANLYRAIRKTGMSFLGFSFRLPSYIVAEDCAVRLMHTLFDHVTQEKHDTEDLTKGKEETLFDDLPGADEITQETEDTGVTENMTEIQNVDKTDENHIEQDAGAVNETELVKDQLQREITTSIEEKRQASLEKIASGNFEDFEPDVRQSENHIPLDSEKLPLCQEPDIQIVNHDEYFLVGGIFHFDLLVVPDLTVRRGAFTFISRQMPKLRRIHYRRKIFPSTSLDGTTSDSFSMKEKQQFNQILLEAVFVQFQLARSVMYLEDPEPAQWLKDKNGYSKDSIWETNYVKEKKVISFKTFQFGIFGMLQKKYQNFPYKSKQKQICQYVDPTGDESKFLGLLKKWTLKGGNPVTLTLDGKYLSITIAISEEGYTVVSLNIEDDLILSQVAETFIFAEQLVEKLCSIGMNIEMKSNADKFVDIVMKDPEVEDKVNDCMALLCEFCSFSSITDSSVPFRENILLGFCIENEEAEIEKVLISKGGVEDFNAENQNKEESIELENVSEDVEVELKQQLDDTTSQFAELDCQPGYTDLYHFAIDKVNQERKEDIIATDIRLIENVRSLLRICRPISSMGYTI